MTQVQEGSRPTDWEHFYWYSGENKIVRLPPFFFLRSFMTGNDKPVIVERKESNTLVQPKKREKENRTAKLISRTFAQQRRDSQNNTILTLNPFPSFGFQPDDVRYKIESDIIFPDTFDLAELENLKVLLDILRPYSEREVGVRRDRTCAAFDSIGNFWTYAEAMNYFQSVLGINVVISSNFVKLMSHDFGTYQKMLERKDAQT